MSKKSNQQDRKMSKRELRRLERERARRQQMLKIWGPIALVVIALVAFIIIRANEPEVEGVVFSEAAPPNQHDASVTYPTGGLPPMGGVHSPQWLNCGIYTEPVPAENAIHSMEHGAVWITYHPDLPADQVALLQDKVRGESYLILSPYPDQSAPIALTVWDAQLTVESATDERIDQFIARYRGTRAPERGAPCSGGVGAPLP
ncbi:MAG: DUF3105 domain-containing protein [Chloroflexi bacterium]|nr:MAG: DUF3105 domain-containing protein [Chloroflexota bacterium]